MKRTLIILAVVIVVLGAGVGLYFLFFNSAPKLTVGSNPFGTAGAGTNNPTGEQTASTGAGTVVAPNLIHITNNVVAHGMVAFDIPAVYATSTVSLASSTASSTGPTLISPADIEIRYVDRQSGNIYAYRARARSLARISNKTLPGIQEASWLPNGAMAFVRFLTQVNNAEQLNTYALPANGTDGYFLSQDLSQAFVTGSSTLFTLSSGTQGSVGTVARTDGTSPRTLFTSPLSSLVVKAGGTGFIATTRAAATLDGYAFSISSTGAFTPVLGALPALTTLPSPSGKLLLYSYLASDGFHMNVLSLIDGSVTQLPLATLAEKCAWTSDSTSIYCGIPTSYSGTLPDDWYQGAFSFTDRIWRIDLASRLATLVLDPSQTAKTTMDIVNPTLDPNTQSLVFINKKDGSLWLYNL